MGSLQRNQRSEVVSQLKTSMMSLTHYGMGTDDFEYSGFDADVKTVDTEEFSLSIVRMGSVQFMPIFSGWQTAACELQSAQSELACELDLRLWQCSLRS